MQGLLTDALMQHINMPYVMQVFMSCLLCVAVVHADDIKNITGYEITKAGIGRHGVSTCFGHKTYLNQALLCRCAQVNEHYSIFVF